MHASRPLFGYRYIHTLLLIFIPFFLLAQVPINNDPCPTDANPPIDLTSTGSHIGTTCEATFDYTNLDCGVDTQGASVWYTYTPNPIDGGYDIILSSAGGSDDAEGPITMEIYKGTTNQGCTGFFSTMASSCNATNATRKIPNDFITGQIIYIKITTDPSESNCGEFNISVQPGTCGEFANTCADITDLEIFYPTTNADFTIDYNCIAGCIDYASPDPSATGGCAEFADYPTLWYKVEVDENAQQLYTTVQADGTWSAVWSIYGGDDCSNLEIISSVGQTCSNEDTTPELFSIAVESFYESYWIAVSIDPASVPVTGIDNGAFEICVATTINGIICLGDLEGGCTESSLIIEVTERELEGQSLDGPFCPGEEVSVRVSFFYDATETSSDWLSGFVPKFGPGWNLEDFDYNAFAPIGNGQTAEWLEDDGPCAALIQEDVPHLCTYIDENGNLALCNNLCEACPECPSLGMMENDPLPSGYFWVTNGGSADCTNDCTPQGGWGIGSTIAQIEWEFTLSVKDYVDYESCFVNNDLQISFQTFSQGVVGCWEDPVGECLIDKSQFGPLWKVDCIVPPEVTGMNQEICSGDNTEILVSTTDGSSNKILVEVEDNPFVTGENDYEFEGGSGTIIDNLLNTSNDVQVVTYSVSAENTTLTCSAIINTIEVLIYPSLDLFLNSNFVCEGGCTDIGYEISGGSGGPYEFLWSTGETTPTINVCPIVATTYSLTLTDQIGCLDFDDVQINVSPFVEIILPESIQVCKDDSFDISNPDYFVCLDFLSGSSPYSITWNPPPGLVGSPSGIFGECFSINEVLSSEFAGDNGTYILSALATDNNGCLGEAQMTVAIQGELNMIVEVSNYQCGDTEANITATGFDSAGNPITNYLLYGGCPGDVLGDFLEEGSSNSGAYQFEILNLLNYTCYTVIAQTNEGCQIIEDITIPLNQGTPIDITGTLNVCEGDEATITIQNASEYDSFMWSPSIGASGSVTFTPDSTITYFVQAIDAQGCASDAEFTVIVNDADSPLCADPCENQISEFQITGIAFSDDNGNGIKDMGELPLPNVLIEDVTNNFTVFTNIFGVYVIPVFEGDVPLLASINQGQWANPEIENVIIVNVPCKEEINFGFIPGSEMAAANISVNNTITRCDFETKFYITVENLNHDIFNGRVEFTFDEETAFFSSPISSIQVDNNKATFETGNLSGFIPKTFLITLKMPKGSTNLPLLNFTAQVFDGDNILDTYTYSDQLRCSYDPNDKRTYPDRPGESNVTLREESLEYTIRFQNNGNDTAFHVRLIDVLDPNILKSSIRFMDASHPYEACISGDTLFVDFPDILLVDSTTNYAASQGHVSFSCDMDSEVAFGTEIKNTVDIIFDSNDPIVTNTTLNTVVEKLCSDTTINLAVEICQGDDFEGYTETGSFEFTLETDLGCDSIIMLELEVIAPELLNIDPIIACGDNFSLEVLGNTFTVDSTGIYEFEIEGPSGCIEQIVNADITLVIPEEKFEEFTLCSEDTIIYDGVSYEFDSSGTYVFEILHSLGCVEELLTFDVTVVPIIESYQEFDFCGEDGLIFTFEDNVYEFDSTGIYTYFIEGESGCDEIELTFDITVYPTIFTDTDTTICEGQSYEGLEVSGVYTIESFDPLTGCPSFETVTLNVLPLSDPNCTVGIEYQLLNNIKIYPVPASEVLYIESDYQLENLSIFSTTGKLLLSAKNIRSEEFKLDVSDLVPGFHLLMIETDQGRIMKKVIIGK